MSYAMSDETIRQFRTKELPMTSEIAYATIKNLRENNKKKFSDEEKRALEYAMVMIAQRVGEEVLSRGAND